MAPRIPGPHPLLVVLALVLCACTPSASSLPGDAPAASDPVASPSTPPASDPVFPVRLTDDAGREVTLEAEPQRIVSLAPSNTEIVCALGACDRLVGVTDFDDYPPEVAEVDPVVVNATVDLEAVVDADPDLVLAAGNELTRTTVIEQLIELGLTVLTLYPESLEEVYADIELVGTALGRTGAAFDLVEEMGERVDAVEASVAGLDRPRVFYEVSVFEGVIYTAGEASFLASLIEIAGGEPITGDPLSTSIELEQLVEADPEVILLGDAAYDPTITPESVAARPGWDGMTAVQDERIRPVVDDIVVTRPGPRIVDGLESLADLIHPDRGES